MVIFAALQPVLSRLIPSHLVLGAVGLASTFVALLLTNLISSGLAIKGVGTWILATLIVWVVTMLATWALSRWIRPNRAAPHRIRWSAASVLENCAHFAPRQRSSTDHDS